MSFLPENYKIPETWSNYLKFVKDWDTKFRIMSDSLVWWLYFDAENKPHRTKEMPSDWKEHAKINEKSGKQEEPKQFRAFIVWNFDLKRIQILEITQKTIQNQIMSYYKDADRWDPKDYNLKVSRTGEWFDTEYQVKPLPKSNLWTEETQAFLDAAVKLEKLWTNEDPRVK